MNGIEKITQRIDEEAQAEIDRILSEGASAAAQIEERYRTQGAKEAADRKARGEQTAAEQEERLVSVAQLEARKTALAARQEMVDRAFDLALERLCAMPDDVYAETVARLLTKAAPDGRGQVLFSSEVRERIGPTAVEKANALLGAAGHLTLSADTRKLRGGFVLVNGSVEVNGSFETLVRLGRGTMAGEVAKLLFQQP